ncbi:C1 family peptidase [Chitinophaga pinensis]|uniref:Aminopeptidase n=1 Tax=Chitinophaga pinensis (strain ATCC 43595 / DSM 2588 / LMG 13176 / NBRC 15968 / NCIMB 11800 / UQM 2034) TaxID=485918 RepID=A0A979FZX8_CHIPD|nr:C1 family peptidase [Chitinophaga pinensis]ACU58212.1 peptidase C1B bleomycin hydrolase [Chitinophaga pinensis DSM 2588]
MKKWALCLAVFCSTAAIAQTTNKEGSNYKFTVVKNLDAGDVENQGNTGTCWSFSGLSFFQAEALRNGKGKDVNLSEMFVVRRMYPLKAANYVRMHGKANFGEGGGFPDDLLCLRQYGLVPQSVYDGNRVKTYNHAEMTALLEGVVKKIGATETTINPNWNKAVDGVLNAYIGDAPEKFEYNGKSYTSRTFAKDLGLDADDYVMVTSFTHHPYYEQFVLEVPDNWNWDKMYNVTLNDLTTIAENAIQNGYTIAWAADVSEKGFNFAQGLAIVPDVAALTPDQLQKAFTEPVKELTITPELRQQAFDNYETQDDHGMHIVGMAKDQNGKVFFRVKNSWGTANPGNGYFYASEPYFAYKTTSIMVNKKAIPADIAKKLGIK